MFSMPDIVLAIYTKLNGKKPNSTKLKNKKNLTNKLKQHSSSWRRRNKKPKKNSKTILEKHIHKDTILHTLKLLATKYERIHTTTEIQ